MKTSMKTAFDKDGIKDGDYTETYIWRTFVKRLLYRYRLRFN